MSWFPLNTGGKAAFLFLCKQPCQEGDLAVILDLHFETDWWLLSVKVLQEDVNAIPIQDGEGSVYNLGLLCQFKQQSSNRSTVYRF